MKAKKLLAFICAMAVTSGLFTGAAAAEETQGDTLEHVDITIGGINLSNSDSVEGWPSEVVQKLEEKFNVTLKIKHYDNESLNLDLSGGTTCDIVQINDDHIEGVIKGKHAVNLEDYRDTLATNIFRDDMEFRNNILKNSKATGRTNSIL